MGKSPSLPFLIMLVLIAVFLITSYLHRQSLDPYYFLWDLDHTISLDALLIQSGGLPDHINHPGYGLNLWLFGVQKLHSLISIVPPLTFEELGKSLNPLVNMSWQVSLLREQSPWMAFFIVMVTGFAFYQMFALSEGIVLLTMLFLGMNESLWYQITMMRTELYAVFFWVMGLLFIPGFLKKSLYPLLIGFFWGLAFLTKIQIFFFLALSPLLIILALTHSRTLINQSERPHLATLISGGNLFFFLILFFLAAKKEIGSGLAIFSTDLRINQFFYAFLFLLIAMVMVNIVMVKLKKSWRKLPLMSFMPFNYSFQLMMSGFLLSFLTHFLLYKNGATSFLYLLYDFKVIFIRRIHSQTPSGLLQLWENFCAFFTYNPWPLVFHFVILGLFLQHLRRQWWQLGILIVLSTLMILGLILGLRPIFRDLLWWELAVNVVNLFLLFTLLSLRNFTLITLKKEFSNRYFQLSIGLFLIAGITKGFSQASLMIKRVDSTYHHYGFDQSKWLDGVYSTWRYPYGDTLRKFFLSSGNTGRMGNAENMVGQEMVKLAFKQARDEKWQLRVADFVFPNSQIKPGKIGVMAKDFPLWWGDWSWRIQTVPEQWVGAILIDLNPSESWSESWRRVYNMAYYDEKSMSSHSEGLDKVHFDLKKRRELAIIPRRDLLISLFVDEREGDRDMIDKIFNHCPHELTENRLVAQQFADQFAGQLAEHDKQKQRVLREVKIRNFCVLPLLEEGGLRYPLSAAIMMK